MLLTVTAVIFFAAIIVCFSKEISAFFKKVFKLPGAKLFIPLFLATIFIVYDEPWILWAVLGLKAGLHRLIHLISGIFPFQTAAYFLFSVLILLGITLIPIYAINYWKKRTSYEAFKYSVILGLVLWIIAVILYSVNLN